MTSRGRALLLGGIVALALWATACSGGNAAATSTPAANGTNAAGTATSAAASPTAGAALPVRNEPDASRAWAHLEMLANTIGSRPSTSANERRAAEYIRDQLTSAGYKATLEEFPVQATLGGAATLTLPDASLPQAAPLGGSANGKVSDPVVFAGIGRTSEFATVDVRGKIAVVDRGELTFGEKVHNAQAAGAAGLIVVNNQPGLFRGDLSGEPTQIPAVSVASETRASLEAVQRSGAPTTLEVTTTRVNGTSQNVVGKPSDAPCKAYLGAHYDSVPAGPGANDNGSGTALMIELARARRYDGLCVIAFGSEEVGLFGSKAYVRDHNVGADAMFMMNFDMVAKITSAVVIGDADLTALAKRIAAGQGFEVQALASIGPGSSSDHATFQSAGVPVLMFHSGNDEFIHTDRDNMSNVSQDDLGRFLKAAAAVLDQLLGG